MFVKNLGLIFTLKDYWQSSDMPEGMTKNND